MSANLEVVVTLKSSKDLIVGIDNLLVVGTRSHYHIFIGALIQSEEVHIVEQRFALDQVLNEQAQSHDQLRALLDALLKWCTYKLTVLRRIEHHSKFYFFVIATRNAAHDAGMAV